MSSVDIVFIRFMIPDLYIGNKVRYFTFFISNVSLRNPLLEI